MTPEQIVKARKPHQCAHCLNEIPKGSQAKFFSAKQPVFDSNEIQTGIEYVKSYFCHKSGCDERLSVSFKGKTFEMTPYFWNEDPWFFAQCLEDTDLFVAAESLEALLKSIYSGDLSSHEEQRIKEETEDHLRWWIHHGRVA